MSLSTRLRSFFAESPIARERPVERLRALVTAQEANALRAERIVPDLRSDRFRRDLANVAEGDRAAAADLRGLLAHFGVAAPEPVRDVPRLDGITFQKLSALAEAEAELAREALSLASIEEEPQARALLERAGDRHRTQSTEIALAATLITSFVR
ncbi:MAG: hypothetical protein U0610_09655 [bacterium]